jgi:hypothetical protein
MEHKSAARKDLRQKMMLLRYNPNAVDRAGIFSFRVSEVLAAGPATDSCRSASEGPMVINGLPLPGDLLALMEAGRWKAPTDHSRVDRLFPENGGLCLYSVELMESETRTLFDPQFRFPPWLGVPDPENRPGDIDPRLAVFVADLGHGFEQPIALDYRVSRDRPQVITLRWSEGGRRNRWVFVAPDIKAFAELAGL